MILAPKLEECQRLLTAIKAIDNQAQLQKATVHFKFRNIDREITLYRDGKCCIVWKKGYAWYDSIEQASTAIQK